LLQQPPAKRSEQTRDWAIAPWAEKGRDHQSRGKRFFSREVVEILHTHPNVMHAAMVGLRDVRLGERNCLCVIPKSGRDLSLDEAVTFVKDQIADYKLPETIERFEEFPMTGTEKIRRHVLRDQVLARHSRQARSVTFAKTYRIGFLRA
jgi:non-ribosomal peptide synthetase component E (peptide arylation enzyme)